MALNRSAAAISMLALPTPGVYSFDPNAPGVTFNGTFINLSASLQAFQDSLDHQNIDNTHIASSLWVCASAVWGLAGLYIITAVWKQAKRRHILTWPTGSSRQRRDGHHDSSLLRKGWHRVMGRTGPIALTEKDDSTLNQPTPFSLRCDLTESPSKVVIGSPAEGAIFGRRAARQTANDLQASELPAENGISILRPEAHKSHDQVLPMASSSHLHQSVRFSDSPNIHKDGPGSLLTIPQTGTVSPFSPPISPFMRPDALVPNRPHTNASTRAISPPDDTGPASRHKRQRRLEWSCKFPLYLGVCGVWMFPWSFSMHLYQAMTGQPMAGIPCRFVGIGYFHSSILPLVLTTAVGILVSIEAHNFRDIKLGWMDWRLTVTAFLSTLVISLLPLAQGGYDDTPHVCRADGLGSTDYWLPMLNLAVWVLTTMISVTAYTYTLQEQKVYDSDREVTRRVMIYGISCIVASAFQLPARIFLIINPNPETVAVSEEDLALQILSAMYPLILGAILVVSFVFWDEKATGAELRNRLSMTRAVRSTSFAEKPDTEPEYEYEESVGQIDRFGLDWHDDYRSQSWMSSERTAGLIAALDTTPTRRSSTWSFHYPDELAGMESNHRSRPATLISSYSSPSLRRTSSPRSSNSGSIQVVYQKDVMDLPQHWPPRL